MMETVSGKMKNVRVSAQKVRLVLNQVRGLKLEKALDYLSYSPNKASGLVKKLLESVIANAEHNFNMDIDLLKIVSIYADEGRVLKRWNARARGRSSRINKRSCHIGVVLTQTES